MAGAYGVDTTKTFKTRIQNKHDTEANWTTASNATKPFVPLEGEFIVYSPDSTHTSPRVKVGDGSTKVGDLAFIGGDLSKYVDLTSVQAITGKKTFNYIDVNNTVSADAVDTKSGTYFTGEGVSIQLRSIKQQDLTEPGTKSIALPFKAGTVALLDDIPSVPDNILTYNYTFDTTGKVLSYPLMIAENPSSSADMTRIDEGSITFRDLSRNNYEGTTQLVVAQVNNNDPVVVSLPSSSGELALKSDIPVIDNYVTKIEKTVVSSSWSTSSVTIDTQFGTYYYDVTIPNKTITSIRTYSTLNTTGVTLDYAPEIKCNNRKTSSTNVRFYTNTKFEGNIIITLMGDNLPQDIKKTTTTISMWSTSSAAVDTQFGKYYQDIIIPTGDIMSVRTISAAKLTTAPAADYCPEVWADNRRTGAESLRIYSNTNDAVTATVVTMEV